MWFNIVGLIFKNFGLNGWIDWFCGGGFGDEYGGCFIVDCWSVFCGYSFFFFEYSFKFGEFFGSGIGMYIFVLIDDDFVFFCRDLYCGDFILEDFSCLCFICLLLVLCCELILIFMRNGIFFGDVFGMIFYVIMFYVIGEFIMDYCIDKLCIF